MVGGAPYFWFFAMAGENPAGMPTQTMDALPTATLFNPWVPLSGVLEVTSALRPPAVHSPTAIWPQKITDL